MSECKCDPRPQHLKTLRVLAVTAAHSYIVQFPSHDPLLVFNVVEEAQFHVFLSHAFIIQKSSSGISTLPL